MIAGKAEIRADVRIARRQLRCQPIIQNGTAHLAGFEQRVAEVEIESGGNAAVGDDFPVSGRGIRKFALLIKFVGLFEGRWDVGVSEA